MFEGKGAEMKKINTLVPTLILGLLLGAGCATTGQRLNTDFKPDTGTTLDIEIDKIVINLSKQLPENSNVLVLNFSDLDGVITHFGKYMAERITLDLSNFQGLTVVERQNIKLVLEEQKLQLSGVVDEKTAVRIGKLVGANEIIYGTITELENVIALNLRIVNVERAIVIGGVSHNISKTQEVVSLVGTIIKTEEETMRELEEKRQTILQEIQAEKQRRLKAIEKEEQQKKSQLAKLEREIRQKSIIIAEYEQKKKALQEKEAYINRIHREIDRLNDAVCNKLKFGMTLQQVQKTIGKENLHYAYSTLADTLYISGAWHLYFTGGVLTRGDYYGGQERKFIQR